MTENTDSQDKTDENVKDNSHLLYAIVTIAAGATAYFTSAEYAQSRDKGPMIKAECRRLISEFTQSAEFEAKLEKAQAQSSRTKEKVTFHFNTKIAEVDGYKLINPLTCKKAFYVEYAGPK